MRFAHLTHLVLIATLATTFSFVSVPLSVSVGLAAEADDAHPLVHSEAGSKKLSAAYKQMEKRNFEKAVDRLTDIIERPDKYNDRDISVAHQLRGFCYSEGLNKQVEALVDLNMAINNPGLPEKNRINIFRSRTIIYLTLGRLEDALRQLNLWTEEAPRRGKFHAMGRHSIEYARLTTLVNLMLGDVERVYNDLSVTFVDLDAQTGGDARRHFEDIVKLDLKARQEEALTFTTQLNSFTLRYVPPTPVKITPPFYPEKMARRRVEGWVIMEFDIDASGKPLNIVVQDSSPKGAFEREALKAIEKWEFEPMIINGVSALQKGKEYQITFQLDD